MTPDINTFRWLQGAPPALQHVRRIKGDANAGRQVHLMADAAQQYAMKLHRLRNLANRWRAARRRSRLCNEYALLRCAHQRGLPVPEALAYGQSRSCGLPSSEALVIEYFDHRTPLRDLVRRGDDKLIRRATETLIHQLAAIRRAAIADADFTYNALLVEEDNLAEPAWIDLEAAYEAPPQDAAATAATAGMALASVWVATDARTDHLRAAYDLLRETAPEPAGGWDAATAAINLAMQQGCAKAVRRGRITALPEPLQ